MQDALHGLTEGNGNGLGPGRTRARVLLRARNTLTAHGWVIKQRFTRRERLTRGIAAWLLAWGLAVAAVFVPVAHFVLVPLLVLAGPIAGYLRYRVEEVPTAAQATCPLCEHDFGLKLEASATFPRWDVCAQCNGTVELRLALAGDTPGDSA